MIARAFGWGSAIAVTRMACNFLSIKVTAVALGPSGLALVAQFTGFVSLLQSMVGQGLVTGSVRLGSERPPGQPPPPRPRTPHPPPQPRGRRRHCRPPRCNWGWRFGVRPHWR